MICKRCGREFENPVPEITAPKGDKEIATVEWCDGCNAFAMSVLKRGGSAYQMMKLFKDPTRGGD